MKDQKVLEKPSANGKVDEPEKEVLWINANDSPGGSIARWMIYSAVMFLLLIPFLWGWQIITGSLLLGHFAAQINSLKNK